MAVSPVVWPFFSEKYVLYKTHSGNRLTSGLFSALGAAFDTDLTGLFEIVGLPFAVFLAPFVFFTASHEPSLVVLAIPLNF